MTQRLAINSKEYWNFRFLDNWQVCDGPSQSRFFAQLAAENMPQWLSTLISTQSLTLADWGCAQGDGTVVLASYLEPQQITGVDFSEVSIQQAKERYPDIRFICENWLIDCVNTCESYDVVFSSNTLEHFHNPYEVLEVLCTRARKAVVLALPYRELQRIDEHFYTFLPENIPHVLKNGFHLVWSRVVDCRKLPNSLWDGYQIFLVYAEDSWLRTLSLSLIDTEIAQEDFNSLFTSLNQLVAERDSQIANLNQTLAQREAEIANLNQAVTERDRQITSLNQMIAQCESKILNKFKRLLRFIRLLARAIWNSSSRYELLKVVYWRLPEAWRLRLQKYRAKYIAAYWSAPKNKIQKLNDHTKFESNPQWVENANTAKKIMIITCAFEFDELFNQRPINAAKYFSSQGYLVFYVAWQWYPAEKLVKGSGVVWQGIYQIPLYEFVEYSKKLPINKIDAVYFITLPARMLTEQIYDLRQKGYKIVYDIMDDWEEFNRLGQAPWFEKDVEEQLILQCDLVTCVSPALADKFSRIRDDIKLIGNGFSPSILGCENRFIAKKPNNKRVSVIGYFGHLTDAWFDWDLVFQLASRNKDLRFEIIGYGEPDWIKEKISSYSNIQLVGTVKPSDLHNYVKKWHAGIIPFSESALSIAVDPIKIYEYIYFGLIVFVTGIPHLVNYPGVVYAERKQALTIFESFRDFNFFNVNQVESFLDSTSWDSRFDSLLNSIHQSDNIGDLYVS